MKRHGLFVLLILLSVVLAPRPTVHTQEQPAPPFPPARFHHLHLNSVNPAAAADYYAKAFASATRATLAGFEGVRTNDGTVYLLFTKVDALPPTGPQSAIWHFGWNTLDSRKQLEKFHALKLDVIPMYADPEGTVVEISSDGFPGFPTATQIAELRAKGTGPTHVGGFQYLRGPDGTIIENAGNSPAEYFNHVHMFHENPVCAQLWYATHLGATVSAGRGEPATARNCVRPYSETSYPAFDKQGYVRDPSGSAGFGNNVSLSIRPRRQLVSPRGQVVDHIGLSVPDLPATLTRLRREGVKVTEDIHPLGDTRAAMIEGPDLIALELIELK